MIKSLVVTLKNVKNCSQQAVGELTQVSVSHLSDPIDTPSENIVGRVA